MVIRSTHVMAVMASQLIKPMVSRYRWSAIQSPSTRVVKS